jgi:hypothetical protein
LCQNDGFACEERGCEERVYENDNGSDEMSIPKACNLIGTLSVCEWIERTKPTTEEIKIISEMPSLEEEIENAYAPCDSVTNLDQVRRSLHGLKVISLLKRAQSNIPLSTTSVVAPHIRTHKNTNKR